MVGATGSIRARVAAALAALVALGCGDVDARPEPGAQTGSEPVAQQPERAPAAAPARIAAGGGRSFVAYAHTCATVAGGVQCWGADDSGQLGDGFATVRHPLPARVRAAPGFADASAISAGRAHTCAVSAGQVFCWGRNDRRQIGVRQPSLFAEPARIGGLPGDVRDVAAGDEFSCALAAGRVYCWGRGSDGELGREPAERCGGYRDPERCDAQPQPVAGIGGAARIAAGAAHACAIAAGRVHCWGRNEHGQLGDGTTASRAAPAAVPGIEGAVSLAAGAAHTCASTAAGVWCWGRNDRGQLGDGSGDDRTTPVAVAGVAGGAALAAGAAHTCALADGVLACWGANDAAQLGRDGPDALAPLAVAGVDGARAVAASVDHTCVVRDDGRAWCFGANDFGQLGRGTLAARSATPQPTTAWDDGSVRDRDGDGRTVVVCLGDSNTQAGYRVPDTWCEQLGRALDDPTWVTVNRGWAGATAISLPSLRRAADQLDYALTFDAPDAVILAYGTNDLLQQAAPEDVLAATMRLVLRAREFGVDAFVALVPPSLDPSDRFEADVRATNELLRRAVRPERLIDFASGFGPQDYADPIHFNGTGHARRARAALAGLKPAR